MIAFNPPCIAVGFDRVPVPWLRDPGFAYAEGAGDDEEGGVNREMALPRAMKAVGNPARSPRGYRLLTGHVPVRIEGQGKEQARGTRAHKD